MTLTPKRDQKIISKIQDGIQAIQDMSNLKARDIADSVYDELEPILASNQQLREALEKIADPTKRHKEPDDYTEKCCMMHIANEALERK